MFPLRQLSSISVCNQLHANYMRILASTPAMIRIAFTLNILAGVAPINVSNIFLVYTLKHEVCLLFIARYLISQQSVKIANMFRMCVFTRIEEWQKHGAHEAIIPYTFFFFFQTLTSGKISKRAEHYCHIAEP